MQRRLNTSPELNDSFHSGDDNGFVVVAGAERLPNYILTALALAVFGHCSAVFVVAVASSSVSFPTWNSLVDNRLHRSSH